MNHLRSSLQTFVTAGTIALLLALVLTLHPAAAQSSIVDQSFTSPTNLGAHINECCRYVAQTFTAGVTGTLAGVNIRVTSGSSLPLHVAIRTVTNGVPNATVLGETTINSSNAPLSLLITFPQTINIVAGQQYAIVVNYENAPPPGPGQSQGSWIGAGGDAYTGGDLYASPSDGISWFALGPGADGQFQTYVIPQTSNLPTVSANGPYSVLEGGSVTVSAWGTPGSSDTNGSAQEITADPNTMLLDHFNQSTNGTPIGSLAYEASLPGLGHAGVYGPGTFVKYSVPGWYSYGPGSSPSTQGTIEMWVKPSMRGYFLNFNWNNTTSVPPAGHVLYGFGTDPSSGVFGYGTWNGERCCYPSALSGTSSIPTNAWTHLAVSWSPTVSKVYVNGNLEASVNTNVYPAISNPVYVYLNEWGTGSFAGLIDELHISSIQRSDAEIQQHATRTSTLSDPLSFAWDLDNDGTFETPGQSATFSATALDGPSSYPIKVRVTDSGGLSATDETVVAVQNVAPTASFHAPIAVDEGSPISLALVNPLDSSSADTAAGLTYAFDCGSGYGSAGMSNSAVCPTTDDGTRAVKGKIIDKDGGETEYSANVTINNVAPALTIAGASEVDEGALFSLSLTASDPGVDTITSWIIDWGDGASKAVPGDATSVTHTYAEGPNAYTVTATATDEDGSFTANTLKVTVHNVAPVVTTMTGSSAPVAAGSPTTVAASFTDVGMQDTHSCSFAWDDGQPDTMVSTSGAGAGSCMATHTYAVAGVYTVQVTVSDDDTGTASDTYEFVVIYDPSAGFVTGGGWINSPAGAYTPDSSLIGKATFGFVSKYQKGATTPSGQTEFQFQVANFKFQSTTYQWLVVSGAKAQYKGTGMVNGTSGYGFLLTATDGQVNGGGGVDKFRIKIWEVTSGTIIYDNVLGGADDLDAATPQAIGGGSIVIHKNK